MNNSANLCEMFSSIQGEGLLAGRRQIFIRFSGCNLECSYCDTVHAAPRFFRLENYPGSGDFADFPQPVPPEKLSETIGKWTHLLPGAHHSISITGGEPLLHSSILEKCLPELRKLLPVHLETNGTLPEQLETVVAGLDFISMDIKLPSVCGTGENLWEPHCRFLEIAAKSTVSVKIVVSNATPESEISRTAALICHVDPSIPLIIQPLTLRDGTVGIGIRHLFKLQESASKRLADVRVLPQMHKMLGAF